ncbi:MAG TPA: hypothetical protein VFF94_08975, partial [Novosphingobium sp.]|nr:hypothetical protein [Novosphingobium sp.]
ACRATQPLAPLRDSLYGRYHKLYWYAPAAKRWVKLVERYDDINGDPLARSSMELESYRLSS